MSILKYRILNLKRVRIVQKGIIFRLNLGVGAVLEHPDFSILNDEDLEKLQLFFPVVFSTVKKNVVEVIVGEQLVNEFLSREIWRIAAFEAEPINANQVFRLANLAYGMVGRDSATRMAAVHIAQEYISETDNLFSEGYLEELSVRQLCGLARVSPNSVKNKKRKIREALDSSFFYGGGHEATE